MKLKVFAFALTCGILWGTYILALSCWICIANGPYSDVSFLQSIYIGYSIHPTGIVIGLIWGFFNGCILGLIFALLYNYLCEALYRKNPAKAKDSHLKFHHITPARKAQNRKIAS